MPITIQSIERSSLYLADVKRLGKDNAATLGFFPEGAFDDHAQMRQILIAVDERAALAGYLLYRVANRIARIVHLCVDRSYRGKGVAKFLVDELKRETTELVGISLKCRRDYDANKIWPRLGFIARDELKGRGQAQQPLIYWWYDHANPTLFDLLEVESKSKIVAAIDANVFFDLDDSERDGHEESNALTADWLSDTIELAMADEIFNEINQSCDTETRSISRARAKQFRGVKYDRPRYDAIYRELESIHPKWPQSRTHRDMSDIKHLAMATAADLSYFVTRDAIMLRQEFRDTVFERHGLRILRPSDFVRNIDELKREHTYEPARLSGTILKFSLVRAGQESKLAQAFHQSEPINQFKKRLRGFLANVEATRCSVVEAGGELLAFVVSTNNTNGRAEIPMFRVRRGKLASTLTRHLIVNLVNTSIEDQVQAIEFTDEYLDADARAVLIEDGFVTNEKSFTKFHIATIGPRELAIERIDQVDCRTVKEKSFIGNVLATLKNPLFYTRPALGAELEKILFPLKIIDAPIETYMIPIRPNWAKELFDSDIACQGLFSSREDLALRKEQVYYRSRLNHAGIKPPARILWYVSKDSALPHKSGAIRACSTLLEVTVDRPKLLFQRNKRLGIYSWNDVLEAANGDIENDIMALRFGSTELFSNQITLKELEMLAAAREFKLRLFSVGKVPQSAFAEIYARGTNKNAAEQ